MGTFRYLVLGGLGLLAGLGAPPAFAGTVTLNFATIGADGGAVCAANCVIAVAKEHDFTSGGVTVGDIGYNGTGSPATWPVAFLTQKPASNGTDEEGLGESNTFPTSSDVDFEITPSTAVLIDNSLLPAGDKSVSITVGSIQQGEGAKVYTYTPPGGTPIGSGLVFADLTLIATLTNPTNSSSLITQSVNTAGDTYIVVTGFNADGEHPLADVQIGTEVVSTGVPEPSTWAMMMVGFAGLGFAAYRGGRRRPAISIV